MQVRLNGKPSNFDEGIDVLKLLEGLGINPKTVVVELNRKIVNRNQYASTQLKTQDEIEVVQFVGGGSVG